MWDIRLQLVADQGSKLEQLAAGAGVAAKGRDEDGSVQNVPHEFECNRKPSRVAFGVVLDRVG
jgi:hypothetical protein